MIKSEGLKISEIVDLKGGKNEHLEGLGSIIHDHINKIIYMSVSQRSCPTLIKKYMD